VSSRSRHLSRAVSSAIGCALVALSLLAIAPVAEADFSLTDATGTTDIQGLPTRLAGAHPDLTTTIRFAGSDDVRDIRVELPLGFSGDPTAYPTCTSQLLAAGNATGHGKSSLCPIDSQVGKVDVFDLPGDTANGLFLPLYNLAPERGEAAVFAFNYLGVVARIVVGVRAGDYGLTAEARGISEGQPISGLRVTLWGVPADTSHDPQRLLGDSYLNNGNHPSGADRVSFLTSPTSCPGTASVTTVAVDSWLQPGLFYSTSFDADLGGSPFVSEGCSQLDFSPTIEARPSTNLADSPSGLNVDLHVPQALTADPDGLAEAHLRDAELTLPAGMSVNPASAAGLGACSPAQIGLNTPVGEPLAHFDGNPAHCPDSSKLGTVEVDTPVLDHPLKGTIYLASQNQNPFGSLLALYIAIEDPLTGTIIKLAGHPVADPQNGQLRISFDRNAQLPFEDLKVSLFNGPRAALRTPITCDNFTTTSRMTPWSSPEGSDATPSDTFAITNGANNTPCLKSAGEAPNKPTFSAGTADPAAGTFSPFVLKLARADGTQPLRSIDATLPKGLLAKLAGIPYCPDAALAAAAGKSGRAEQASPSCPATSRVGSVTVGAGAGSTPLYVGAEAYLTGPYKGAPLSLSIIAPAVAGPFDLGTVVVRNALYVDPESAQVHAVSDPIPTILQGIPLDIRSIALSIDRPGFILNPTSCAPTAVKGGALSVFGQSASLTSPFQVGGCAALGFKPKLAIDLQGATKRNRYPALRATLQARPGDANIGKAVVSLPHSAFLAQNHIKTICTRVQFAASACPAASVYGTARAISPLLDKPLEGPVYLRSSSNTLPDLVADLKGQLEVALVGRIDSVKGGIRTSFESVPDAPITKFTLSMQGGKKGLLVNSRNLCAGANKATVELDAQSGKTYDSTPVVSNDCKSKKKGSAKRGPRS
jgi:hypothetical protein